MLIKKEEIDKDEESGDVSNDNKLKERIKKNLCENRKGRGKAYIESSNVNFKQI